MKIAKDHAVSVHYTLTDTQGNIVDSSRGGEPLNYLHGHQNMIVGFEKALDGAEKGQELSFTVSPEEGYGMPVEEAIFPIPRSEIPASEELVVGAKVQGQTESGHMQLFTIVDVNDESITLDGNHPLAGQVLNFDVEIMDIRSATAQEIEHGHIHAHGHDH